MVFDLDKLETILDKSNENRGQKWGIMDKNRTNLSEKWRGGNMEFWEKIVCGRGSDYTTFARDRGVRNVGIYPLYHIVLNCDIALVAVRLSYRLSYRFRDSLAARSRYTHF